jgi:hypothetical protein
MGFVSRLFVGGGKKCARCGARLPLDSNESILNACRLGPFLRISRSDKGQIFGFKCQSCPNVYCRKCANYTVKTGDVDLECDCGSRGFCAMAR